MLMADFKIELSELFELTSLQYHLRFSLFFYPAVEGDLFSMFKKIYIRYLIYFNYVGVVQCS